MITLDPSEVVRSIEIEAYINDNFEVLESFEVGGTLLNLIIDPTIVNYFEESSDLHNNFIEAAFSNERDLIKIKKISGDFKFIIANIKKPA